MNSILSGSGMEDYPEKNNKNNKKGHSTKKSKVFIIINIIFAILTTIFTIYIIKLNMLPIKYVLIAILSMVLITLLLSIGLNVRKKVVRIICTIICIILIAIYSCSYYYINKTMGFIGSMLTQVDETEEYYIVVPKNSSINSITDIKDKTIYVFANSDDISDVKDNISKDTSAKYKEETNLEQLASKLISNKIPIALMSYSQYSMIVDENLEFPEKTKIIHKVTHKINSNNTVSSIKDNNSNLTIEKGIFNIYISGIDTAGNISRVSRSDANILATVNTNTHEVLLTSIPRDYYVTLHSKNAKDKLTHSGIYGVTETVTTVEDLLDVEINYYVRVNFTTLEKLVNVLGGIDVNSDYDFTSEQYTYKKGVNHLNGESALVFSRERHSFADGDRQRGKNQQKVLEAIIKKCASDKTILTKYSNILDSLSGCFQTNVTQDEIAMLVKGQVNNMKSWKVTMTSIDGTGASKTTYSAGSQLLYVMIPNEQTVSAAKQQISNIIK